MSLILDAGALIAYERGSATVRAFLERASRTAEEVATGAGVVAQVWRGDARQARLATLLNGVRQVPLTPGQARSIGALLATAEMSDVVDASLIDSARDGDEILTCDQPDLRALAYAAGKTLLITQV